MAERKAEAPEVARKTRVFISYSRKDGEFVARLKGTLQAKGYEAFVDTQDISGGEKWKRRLEQLILNADAMAFVLSPDSVSSPVCDWETRRALELGKRLIPLVWRPLADEQPPTQLAERNYIYFDNPERFDSAIEALGNALDVDITWVREHTRLVDLATRWATEGRRRDSLPRGAELVAAKTWIATRAPAAPEIPATFHEFIAAAEKDERGAVGVRRWGRAAQLIIGTIAVVAGVGVVGFVGLLLFAIMFVPPGDLDEEPGTYSQTTAPATPLADEPSVVETLGGTPDSEAIARFSGDIEAVGLDPRWAAQVSSDRMIVQYGQFESHTLLGARRNHFARGVTIWDSREAGTVVIREGPCRLLNGVEGDFEALFVREGVITHGCAKRGLSPSWPLDPSGSPRWELPALDEHSDFQ
jgi:uncharacterized membrane protein